MTNAELERSQMEADISCSEAEAKERNRRAEMFESLSTLFSTAARWIERQK